jgi:hypothetical protein
LTPGIGGSGGKHPARFQIIERQSHWVVVSKSTGWFIREILGGPNIGVNPARLHSYGVTGQ